MNAVNKLRNIAKYSRDLDIGYLVEAWIQEHVVEVGNSLHISQDGEKYYREYLESENQRQLRRLAEVVVKEGTQVSETKEKFGTVLTRRVCIIKD